MYCQKTLFLEEASRQRAAYYTKFYKNRVIDLCDEEPELIDLVSDSDSESHSPDYSPPISPFEECVGEAMVDESRFETALCRFVYGFDAVEDEADEGSIGSMNMFVDDRPEDELSLYPVEELEPFKPTLKKRVFNGKERHRLHRMRKLDPYSDDEEWEEPIPIVNCKMYYGKKIPSEEQKVTLRKAMEELNWSK